jgi:hypothetical protein
MKEKTTRVWISKYALTKGIYEEEVIVSDTIRGSVYTPSPGWYWFSFGEWHRTKSEALSRAEEMRLKKVASLEKQLKKYRELRF